MQNKIEFPLVGGFYINYIAKNFRNSVSFSQVEGICNTMRGRVRFDGSWPGVVLGGIRDFVPEIRRCRRILLIGTATSYHVGLATRYYLIEA